MPIVGLAEAAQQACVAAAASGHDQVLEFLLDMSEVDVNRQNTLSGETGQRSVTIIQNL